MIIFLFWVLLNRSLRQEDHLPFAIRLAQIRLKGTNDELDEEQFEYLMRGGESTKVMMTAELSESELAILNEEQKRSLIGM